MSISSKNDSYLILGAVIFSELASVDERVDLKLFNVLGVIVLNLENLKVSLDSLSEFSNLVPSTNLYISCDFRTLYFYKDNNLTACQNKLFNVIFNEDLEKVSKNTSLIKLCSLSINHRLELERYDLSSKNSSLHFLYNIDNGHLLLCFGGMNSLYDMTDNKFVKNNLYLGEQANIVSTNAYRDYFITDSSGFYSLGNGIYVLGKAFYNENIFLPRDCSTLLIPSSCGSLYSKPKLQNIRSIIFPKCFSSVAFNLHSNLVFDELKLCFPRDLDKEVVNKTLKAFKLNSICKKDISIQLI